MRLELRTDHGDPSESESERKPFPIEIEDDKGERKQIDVFVVRKDELANSLGEPRADGVYIRRGINPVLIPIIVQKFYFESVGYAERETNAAALLYGARVLNSEDLNELATLLGMSDNALVPTTARDGNEEYYLECLTDYSRAYANNKWIASARGLHRAGAKGLAMELGRGVEAASKILEDGPVFGTDDAGARVMRAPAMKELLPEVVGALDRVASTLSEQRGTVEITIGDAALLRALYFFTGEFVPNSPISFRDTNAPKGSKESVVEFKSGSAALIRSVLKHLRVDLTNEHDAVVHVLTAARKVYGELSDGASYRTMLLGPAQTAMDPERLRTVMAEMEKLGRTKGNLERSITGKRNRTPSG